MQEKGNHEGCIEQIYRLFNDHLMQDGGPSKLDEKGRIRIDDWEMQDDVQSEVSRIWEEIDTDNLSDISNFNNYKAEFLKLFGFGMEGVNYSAESDPVRELPSIKSN